jgi:5-methylcytosine-specific restriction endonuclease McrA
VDTCQRCEKKIHARGLCSKHYSQEKKLGFHDSPPLKILPKEQRELCSIENCESPVVSGKTFCRLHQKRLERTGDPELVKKVYKYGNQRCAIEGCESKGRLKKGYCPKHYQRLVAHGDPLGGNPSPVVSKAIDHEDGTRTCSQCFDRKPLNDFYVERNSTLGRKSKCKACVKGQVNKKYAEDPITKKVAVRNRRLADPEKYKIREKERYERDKPKRLDLANKHTSIRRARQANVPLDKGITPRRVRLRDGDLCYYCQVEMDFTPAKNRVFKDDHASLEHILPLSKGGGHTWDNVVLACRKCNLSKNNKTQKEFNVYLAEIKSLRKRK